MVPEEWLNRSHSEPALGKAHACDLRGGRKDWVLVRVHVCRHCFLIFLVIFVHYFPGCLWCLYSTNSLEGICRWAKERKTLLIFFFFIAVNMQFYYVFPRVFCGYPLHHLAGLIHDFSVGFIGGSNVKEANTWSLLPCCVTDLCPRSWQCG